MDGAPIYDWLFANCPAAMLPAPWNNLATDARLCPADAAHLLSESGESFSAQDLMSTGVACSGANGQLMPAPALADPQGRLGFLRAEPNGAINNVLTKDGCLAACQLPTLASLQDARTRKAVAKQDNQLVVAFDLGDLLVLRACGMAATLATGLDRITYPDLEKLVKSLRWPCPREPWKCPTLKRRKPKPIELVLLGWSPTSMTVGVPDGVADIHAHFKKICEVLRWDFLDQICLWQPDAELLERLRFLLSWGANRIHETLAEDLDEKRVDLPGWEVADVRGSDGLDRA